MSWRVFLFSAMAAWMSRGGPLQGQPQDLYLLIGQSNMAGRGVVDEAARQTQPEIFLWNKEMQWSVAADPLHWDKPAIAGVGLGRSFAQAVLAARPGRSIGLIPAAFGGSALNEWMPGTPHYENAVARVKAAVATGGRLRGILWHQGEAETGREELASTYAARFAKFAAALRKELAAEDVPWVVGELGEFVTARKESPFAAKVNEELAGLGRSLPRTGFVSAKGLVDGGDNLHFNTESLRELGRRYAAAYLGMGDK